MLYLAPPSVEPARDAMRRGLLGAICQPGGRARPPAGSRWAADNGCFGKWWPGVDGWLVWLDKWDAEERSRCLFALAPDVVGDAAATLIRSTPHLATLRAMGYRAGYVAQDGTEDVPPPWDELDALFVGGSTDWKLGADAREVVREARARGKWVHMGRVNSERRIRYAASLGVDSVDGTKLVWGPDQHLPALLAWVRAAHEPALFDWQERPA